MKRDSAVTEALQAYADRGVFRGFRAAPVPAGRVEFTFAWLTRKPMRAAFDSRRRTLAFPDLFPDLDAASAATLKRIVVSRTGREQPAHKRVDARRARVAAGVRKGSLSLTVTIRGANERYAITKALNLINELFLALHETRPEYLSEHFGISTE